MKRNKECKDSEKMFVTKENEPEIRHIVRNEITSLIVLYFMAGVTMGLLIGYILGAIF